jgi:pyruvate kinase
LPEALDPLDLGTSVWLNEGRIGAKVIERSSEGVELEVFRARQKGEKFRDDMGINFPETTVHAKAITEKDVANLDFICAQADILGYSFVQEPGEMDELFAELAARRRLRRTGRPLGIVAKIEMARAVHNLPELIVRGAGRAPFGVMIARGDLAVQIGYLRIAEIQEEILWICEAAHVPVVWATQVLENLVKKGIPRRAEITDAAMSERAECVMLNKGAFVRDAISILDVLLVRMHAHHRKKMATLRALKSWRHLKATGKERR